MSDKYILNADHSLRQTDDLEEWAQAFEGTERRVARTEIAPGVVVSTVFLGIDHSFGHGLPLVFETMIFRDGGGEEQWRYSTWAEAEEGHQRAVEAAASAIPSRRADDAEGGSAGTEGSAVAESETHKPSPDHPSEIPVE